MKKGDRLTDFKVQCPHCQFETDIFLVSKCPNCKGQLVWGDSLVAYVKAQDLMKTANSSSDWRKAKRLWIQAGGVSGADYWQEKIDFCDRMIEGCRGIEKIFAKHS